MPACYAHYRFGAKALKELSISIQKTVQKNRELYDIGVHGPDILFFYRPLKRNEVNAYGNTIHHESASIFFKKARTIYAKNADKEAMLAYLLGFVAHFALDTTDHPYIAKKMEVSKVSHFAIESEYERHLMATDDKKGVAFKIEPSRYNAKIISRFYPQFSEDVIYKAIKGTKDYNELLVCFDARKKAVLATLMSLVNVKDLKDHLVIKDKRVECLDSDLRLDKLEVKALLLFKELAVNIIGYLNGQGQLDERFDQTFDDAPTADIVVLDLKGEKEYEI